ncbi:MULTISPECIES: DUF262 domain-containing protein [unclassified Burkholderia]|uniref:GmrSD restriction endonuclease domain-containing protein n=1 Tax=unclassified Burkholderia TaxID=2613784 RepID=UPI001420A2FA|nr:MULTISPECIES: DUF262 domain-containing protein [unclassified Burkholderia]NIE60765.1 DUF262 domain-containing protein [Burkholderia sp. Ap-955]NIF12704.1 DUF262 domain-containing protein [Burkholderia sp. Ax-1735]NIG05999.1 DUF262 domain-containing protein [Burkholderia sp. Tr-849]
MQNNLNIRGEPIQTVYTNFRLGKFIVNRRYQRKLVWTLVEKQRFIDSLINQFPVPLFLGVAFEHPSRGNCFEILDGMQRLEAITSFIEGQFRVDGGYFDLSIVAETNRLLQEGKLEQKLPTLNFAACTNILNYPLPISTSTYTTTANVDETFRRINTGGVRLSTHEVRQAGAIADFPQLVRRCAMYIRGDVSHTDIVDLEAMRNISLTSDDLNYGIKVRDTFWNKSHILTAENILASRDEEVVAHILLHLLLKENAKTSSNFLDDVYTDGTEVAVLANDAVLKHGADIIYKQFCFVFDELGKVMHEFGYNLATHLYSDRPLKIQHAYQVIYLAFFDLLMLQNKKIQNVGSLARALKGVATNCMGRLSNDRKWVQSERIQMINSTKGVISSQFIAREGMDPTAISWVDNLQNILNQSRTENVCYDFKIGLHDLSRAGGLNDKILPKVVRTLTAMSNSHAGDSYVIIGVADNQGHALRHEGIYSEKAVKYGDFYVAGVGAEARKFYKNLDTYQQKLHQLIEDEPINDEIKRAIQRNVVFIKYYEKDVVLMKITRGKYPIKYDGKIYVRKIANTDPEPISEKDEFSFFGEFMEQSNRYPYSN